MHAPVPNVKDIGGGRKNYTPSFIAPDPQFFSGGNFHILVPFFKWDQEGL